MSPFQAASALGLGPEDPAQWPGRRQDSRSSDGGGTNNTNESWEFRSALEAPIARLESLDEIEGSQVRETRQFYSLRK